MSAYEPAHMLVLISVCMVGCTLPNYVVAKWCNFQYAVQPQPTYSKNRNTITHVKTNNSWTRQTVFLSNNIEIDDETNQTDLQWGGGMTGGKVPNDPVP